MPKVGAKTGDPREPDPKRRWAGVQLAPSTNNAGRGKPIILRTGRGDHRMTIEEAQHLQGQLYRVLLAAVVGVTREDAEQMAGHDETETEEGEGSPAESLFE